MGRKGDKRGNTLRFLAKCPSFIFAEVDTIIPILQTRKWGLRSHSQEAVGLGFEPRATTPCRDPSLMGWSVASSLKACVGAGGGDLFTTTSAPPGSDLLLISSSLPRRGEEYLGSAALLSHPGPRKSRFMFTPKRPPQQVWGCAASLSQSAWLIPWPGKPVRRGL